MFQLFISHLKNSIIIVFLIALFVGLSFSKLNLDKDQSNTTQSPLLDLQQSQVLGAQISPYITPNIVPYQINKSQVPFINAEAAVVIDQNSYSPLFTKNDNLSTYPASTTKIVSAIVVLKEYNLDTLLTVPTNINDVADGSRMGLLPNDVLSVKELLQGMPINSGNDAAYVLAINYSNGYSGFVEKMNAIVKELNLTSTLFDNPIGYDSGNHFTSPHDLAILSSYAYSFPLFREIVNIKDISITSRINPSYIYKLHNTNTLLGTLTGVNGIKTGWTASAQGVLVTHVNRNGHEIIVVVMRSSSREYDTRLLIEWVYDTYHW